VLGLLVHARGGLRRLVFLVVVLLTGHCRTSPGNLAGDSRTLAGRIEALLAEPRAGGELARKAAPLASAIRSAISQDTSTQLLHAVARLDLALAPGDDAALKRAILRLDALVARDSTDAGFLRDAATAHAELARIDGDSTELMVALDLIERSVLLPSLGASIRIDRARLLEAVSLPGEAAEAWRSAAEAADVAGEAHRRHQEQKSIDARRGRQSEIAAVGDLSDSTITALLGVEPEALREFALDIALPEWADAVRQGHSDSARRYLAAARRVALALSPRDSSVGSALVAITTDSGRAAIANGLAAYRDSRRHFDAGEFELAEPYLTRALTALRRDSGSIALWGWPAVYLAVSRLYRSHYRETDRLLEPVLRGTTSGRLNALGGRAHWAAGLSAARQDRPQDAIDHYRNAIRHFASAGEQSNLGSVETGLAEMYAVLGESRRAVSAYLRATRALLSRRDLGTLQGLLQSFAGFELAAGRSHSAIALLREGLRVSRRTGRNKDVPEALARLAAAEARLGDAASARAHLAEARTALREIESPAMRTNVEMEIVRVEARLASGSEAETLLTTAADYYRGRGIPVSLAPLLVARAGVRLSIGDTANAETDLDDALQLIRQRAGQLGVLSSSAAREVQRGVFERRVALRLSRGDSMGALGEIDGLRSWGGPSGDGIRARAARFPHDHAILAYTALQDRLMLWLVAREEVRVVDIPVSLAELARIVERFEQLRRLDADSAVLASQNASLSRLLLDPIRDRLRLATRITIVADPILAGVSFAALRNPGTGRFLIEDHILSYAFGVTEAFAALTAGPGPTLARVLVVGNPAYDRSRWPELPPLRNAASEMDSLRRLYPGATMLAGADATRDLVLKRLSEAEVFHFAGHALATRRGMRGSRLVLAPGGSADGGLLYGDDIAALRLPNLRLVVLSACETLTQGAAASYRLDGLAEAFLAAGAAGVIGSSWTVDDEGTARIMTRLHRGISAGMSAAEALREAQLAALRRPGGTSARLRTWAAFRFITR
jgi:CHAT domain-containing protein